MLLSLLGASASAKRSAASVKQSAASGEQSASSVKQSGASGKQSAASSGKQSAASGNRSVAPVGGPDRMSAIETSDLTVAYDGDPVLWDASISIPVGSMTAIVGPNGAGKSTLVKAILDLVPKLSGRVDLAGGICTGRDVAYVPQRATVDWDFPITVFDLVMMGTYGHLRWFVRPGCQQRVATAAALDQVGIYDLAKRQIGELSGGQQQRAFIARALVQQPRIFMLDEPMAAVDVTTEASLIACLKRLRDDGKTVVTVHHDLATVPDYFDHVVMVNREIIACGPTATTFTSENIDRTYGQ